MPHQDKHFVTVFLNNWCNMACEYCYATTERNVKKRSIDIEFACRGISDYFAQGFNGLRFFSTGEPTLALGTLRKIYSYAKSLSQDALVTELQTNGVMSDLTAEWIGANIDNIWISWDGPPEVHDVYRRLRNGKGTSGRVEDAARIMLTEKQKQTTGFVGARVTITDANLYRQIEIVDYFKSLGIRYIYSDPVFAPLSNSGIAPNPYYVDQSEYVNFFFEAYNYAQSQDIFYGSFFMINFDGPCQSHCRACLPTPHLTVDGLVSCCDMCCSRECSYVMSDLLYGSWDDISKTITYDEAKITKIRSRRVKNLAPCIDCDVEEYCGGYCVGEVLNETGDFYGVLPERCKAIKELASLIGVNHVHIPVLHP